MEEPKYVLFVFILQSFRIKNIEQLTIGLCFLPEENSMINRFIKFSDFPKN